MTNASDELSRKIDLLFPDIQDPNEFPSETDMKKQVNKHTLTK
jgi:hypothetical protein